MCVCVCFVDLFSSVPGCLSLLLYATLAVFFVALKSPNDGNGKQFTMQMCACAMCMSTLTHLSVSGRARVSAGDYTIFLANKCSIFAESKANDISICSITITSFVFGITAVAIRNHIKHSVEYDCVAHV